MSERICNECGQIPGEAAAWLYRFDKVRTANAELRRSYADIGDIVASLRAEVVRSHEELRQFKARHKPCDCAVCTEAR